MALQRQTFTVKDPVGRKDYTLPVSILAQIIESLKVDIVSQSLSQLKVDIVAQSLPKLEVDIVSAATLNVNISSISSGVVFNVAQSGTWIVNAAQTGAWTINIGAPLDASGNLMTSIQSSVTLNVNISGSTVTLNVNISSISSGVIFNVAQSGTWTINAVQTGTWTINIGAPLDAAGNLMTSIQSSVTLNVNISGSAVTLNVNISSISSGVVFNVAQSGTWTINIGAPLDASGNLKTSIQSSVTLNVNISGSAVTLNVNISSISSGVVFNVAQSGTWTINIGAPLDASGNLKTSIQSSVTLNVNITGSVTLNVSIVSQTVDINIKTSSGANIVIDKLTQAAYTEDRRTLANNGATATMVSETSTTRCGKFFVRGARGFIDTVEVYCDNPDTVARSIYIYFAVQPGMAPVFWSALSVAAGAGAAWRSVAVRKYWNYDSMFVYVRSEVDYYPRFGRDYGTPYDALHSTDEVTWVVQGWRNWIRVNMAGLTVGDLPVSGTVNTIEVPNQTVGSASGTIIIGAGATVNIISIGGPGECQYITLWSNYPSIYWSIKCDGVEQYFMPITLHKSFRQDTWVDNYGDPGKGIEVMVTKHDTTYNMYAAQIAVKLPFKRLLEITAYNPDTVSHNVAAVAVVQKIG